MKLIVAAFTAWLLWFLSGVFLEKFWAKGLQVSLSFLQQAVVEGESACLKETITNNKLLPLPFLHVKFQMGRELLFLDSKNSNITDQNYRSDLFSCMPWAGQFKTEHPEYACASSENGGSSVLSSISI